MKTLLLCIIFFGVWRSKCKEQFDPNKFDYCKVCKPETKNPNKGEHPACRCEVESGFEGRELNVYNKTERTNFRQFVLDAHNKLRNNVAGGNETKIEAQFAADMMVLNWDLEMEYYARCRAMGSLLKGNLGDFVEHEPCRMTQDGGTYGQNYAWNSWYNPKEKPKPETILDLIAGTWYDREIEKVVITPTFFEKFESNPATNELTQMIWLRATRIGCVIVKFSSDKFAVEGHKRALNLLCNYYSDLVKFGGNEVGTYIYKRVDSIDKMCTQCYNGTSCDKKSKYPHLCGKLEKIPTTIVGVDPSRPVWPRRPIYINFAFARSSSKIIVAVIVLIIILIQ